ncbi:mttA/Hcf106 family protein [Anaplasma phagocytophilum str. CRT53-1]|uniref:MttA/Hcf106 family protein n=1 Tax=Anaplasma phagocytophilum str. CRT53-1 TaxID=1359157 RepID=A0A0F3PV30_ANAPH|nr:mttA/Hcf106 family protein [Anaplasma phagocytophilum str. CRT53-1]
MVLLIILVLFGAGKLPQVMGDLGKGMKNLRRELKDGRLVPTKDELNH